VGPARTQGGGGASTVRTYGGCFDRGSPEGGAVGLRRWMGWISSDGAWPNSGISTLATRASGSTSRAWPFAGRAGLSSLPTTTSGPPIPGWTTRSLSTCRRMGVSCGWPIHSPWWTMKRNWTTHEDGVAPRTDGRGTISQCKTACPGCQSSVCHWSAVCPRFCWRLAVYCCILEPREDSEQWLVANAQGRGGSHEPALLPVLGTLRRGLLMEGETWKRLSAPGAVMRAVTIPGLGRRCAPSAGTPRPPRSECPPTLPGSRGGARGVLLGTSSTPGSGRRSGGRS
jgi:hypothetical protein